MVEKKSKGTKIFLDKRNTGALKQMVMRGMSKQVHSIHPYTLEEGLCSFISEVPGLKPKRVSKQKQQEMMGKIIEDPFYAPYLLCIAGKPNDMRAKLLACHLMMKAVMIHSQPKEQTTKQRKLLKGRGLPLLHTLVGGFDNPVIGKHTGEVDHPSMLIITNVAPESSASKIEKLRDILEVHSNIPRIVVVAGSDPLSFFNTKMHMSLTACAFLTSNLVKKSVEL